MGSKDVHFISSHAHNRNIKYGNTINVKVGIRIQNMILHNIQLNIPLHKTKKKQKSVF